MQIETPWNLALAGIQPDTALEVEIAELENRAAEQRRAIHDKIEVANAKRRDWLAVLQAGQTKHARLQHAREQLEILRQRQAAATEKFDALVGGFDFSAEWHEIQRADPLVDGTAYGATNLENPFVHHARTLAALELAIARFERAVPGLELAEAEARKTAMEHARAHGFEHDLDAPESELAATGTSEAAPDPDAASALADVPSPGKARPRR